MKQECQGGSVNANQYIAISSTNIFFLFFYNKVSSYYFSLPDAPLPLSEFTVKLAISLHSSIFPKNITVFSGEPDICDYDCFRTVFKKNPKPIIYILHTYL